MSFNKKIFFKNMPFIIIGICIIALTFVLTSVFESDNVNKQLVDLNDEEFSVNSLVISEVVAANQGVLADENGKLYDFVELYNGTDKDINLKNYGLSDSESEIKWIFPEEVIKSKQYLIIYLCGKNEKGLYANFSLSSSKSDMIVLKNPSGKIIDSIDVSDLAKNQAMIRNGEGELVISNQVTPGYPNTIDGYNKYIESLNSDENIIKINEVLPRNKGNFQDDFGDYNGYVEVINVSNSIVNLAGYSLSDDYNILYKWQFPEILLSPNETVFVYTSSNNRSNDYYAGFKLSEKRGDVILTNNHGKIVDKLEYSGVANGMALVKEDGEFYQTNSISPGYANNNDGVNKFNNKYLKNNDDLIISEVMNSNTTYLPQNGAQYYDFVEVKNNSSENINLSDYYLTTSDGILDMYKLPDKELKPNEYYVIMASGDVNLSNNSYQHANFKLSEIESLYLVKKNKIIESIFIANIPVGYSMGRDANSGYFYFSKPTPLKNNSVGVRQVAYTPFIETKAGVYNDVDSLEVKINGSGTIYYTLDGSVPTRSSKVYNGSLFLSNTAVLKIINYEEGQLNSEVVVASYIINEDDNFPVLSVSMKQSDFSYISSNAWVTGLERAAYAELFEDGKGFSIPCGFKLFGGSTRGLSKKSFTLKFRKEYGEAKLNYQVFENRDYSSYDSLVLRSGSQDYETTFFRDILMTSLVEDLDTVDVQAYKTVSLYINGKYWGLYNIREQVDEHFISNNYNVSPEGVNIVRIDNEVAAGDNIWYRNLTSYLSSNNIALKDNYEYIKTKIDIDSLIDFWIAETYYTNNDIINARFYTHPDINDGKMRAILYDFDWAMYNYSLDYFKFSTSTKPMSRLNVSTVVLRNLMKNNEFKQRYVERLSYHMQNTFTEEKVIARIDYLYNNLKSDISKDFLRWNLNYKSWDSNVEELRKYARLRTGYMLDQAKAFFNLSSDDMKKYFGDLYE